MSDTVLYAPSRERVLTTNSWAFLHWRRATRTTPAADWASLERWSVQDPAGFLAAVHDFAQLGSGGQRLCRHAGPQAALVLRGADGSRTAWSRDALRAAPAGLPPDVERCLGRLYPAGRLLGPLALLLLYLDLRPDDRLFVRELSGWPWLCALLQGTTVILDQGPAGLFEAAATEQASVVVGRAAAISETTGSAMAAERALRITLAVGGPLTEATRRRLLRDNAGAMLLALDDAGRTWGDPLSPVLAEPAPRPALLAWSP